jgi:hypothetical protein
MVGDGHNVTTNTMSISGTGNFKRRNNRTTAPAPGSATIQSFRCLAVQSSAAVFVNLRPTISRSLGSSVGGELTRGDGERLHHALQ